MFDHVTKLYCVIVIDECSIFLVLNHFLLHFELRIDRIGLTLLVQKQEFNFGKPSILHSSYG